MGAYYNNSLKAKRTELLKELRTSMARYASLERQGHPSQLDQGKWIDLTKRFIALIDDEMKHEERMATIPPMIYSK